MQAVVLASGSQYRALLLSRLNVEFSVLSPDIDESVCEGESSRQLCTRLAREKAHTAHKLLHHNADIASAEQPRPHLIIGSDQVASINGIRLNKPGTAARACAQLASMSGQSVDFLTSLYILDSISGDSFSALNVTRAIVRTLDEQSIARYVALDQPLDCAGSFKVESSGISLFESVSSDDPTALIGLPLIKVCEGLRYFGMSLP